MPDQKVVDVLVDCDAGTLLLAIRARDMTLVRMLGGSRPTAEQLALIRSARPQEMNAARDTMRARRVRADNAEFAAGRMESLLRKYSSDENASLSWIFVRMNPDDQRELIGLAAILKDGES